jgi:hypothetical protein
MGKAIIFVLITLLLNKLILFQIPLLLAIL